MSKFVTYPAVTVLDNDHSLLIDDPNAGTNSITAENAGNTLLSKWAGFETFEEAVQNTISNNQEFIDRDTAIRSETAELKKKIVTTFPAKDASGAVATFESEFEDAPLKSCIVQVEPVQSGSGDPSPDNIRPISGWTGCEVQRTGKNFLNPAKYEWQTRTFNGITYTVLSDGSVRAVGTSTAAGGPGLSSRFQLPAGTYYGNPSTGSDLTVLYRYAMQETGGKTYPTSNPFVSDGTQWFYINLYCDAANLTVDTILCPQIELGTSFTGFEPYTGRAYPITFPSEAGTVYGGYVDVTGGELVVDRAMVDLGTKNWLVVSNNNYATFSCTSKFIDAVYNANIPTLICSAYKSGANSIVSPTDDNYVWFNAQKVLRLKDTKRKDLTVEQFKAAMSGVQLVYELAEPIHYPITPIEIRSLLGQNNIWSNTGDTAVEYLMSDVSWYVEKKLRAFQSILAGVEDSASASKNYSANTYLIFNNDIYRVTKAITAGETIEEGVNVTKTTVAEQLMALAQA